MPYFTLPISAQGAVVDAVITVSSARQKMLQDLGERVPPPQLVRALIDTGASMSGVDPAVLKGLELTPTGEAEIHTPSTGGTPVQTATYDVRIGILTARQNDAHFVSDTLQVMAIGLTAHGFQALIGTDVLTRCIFHFNVADGFFTLAY